MKKKILLILVLALMLCYISPVFAADATCETKTNISSCDSLISASVLIDKKVPEITSIVVNTIKIVVPVLLVIMGSIDLLKGVTAQKEDEIKKGQQIFVKRLIAGILVFFVFAIVQLLVGLAAGDSGKTIMDCANCFISNNCSCR